MDTLTPRQIEILKSIVVEYTRTGEPVGSEILDKKYNLGVSPATVRNEMTELAKKGYLKKEHFSSGRVPTTTGFRFYIRHLLKEKEMSTAEEVSYKNDIWDFRGEVHKLLQHAARVLAKKTNMMAVVSTNVGDMYYFGVPNLLSLPEFYDVALPRVLFERLDELSFWNEILRYFEQHDEDIVFVIGNEGMKEKALEPCACVFGEFEGNKIRGAIGVTGSARMEYEMVIPRVKYFSTLIGKMLKEQGI